MFKRNSKFRKSLTEKRERFQRFFSKLKAPPLDEEPVNSINPDESLHQGISPRSNSFTLKPDTRLNHAPSASSESLPALTQKTTSCSNCGMKNEFSCPVGSKTDLNIESATKEQPLNVYKNNSSPRGHVFMHNFEVFENGEYGDRTGSKVDYNQMKLLFGKMGYECNESKKFCRSGSIKKNEFIDSLYEFSQLEKHQEADSCFLIIMSHGCGDKTFICSDGQMVRVKDVTKMMNNINCANLKNKPKILIFQFCRQSHFTFEEKPYNHPEKPFSVQPKSFLRPHSLTIGSCTGSSSSINNTGHSGRAISMISAHSSVFTDSGTEDYLHSPNYLLIPPIKLPQIPKNVSPLKIQDKNETPINYFTFEDADSSSMNLPSQDFEVHSDLYLIFSTVGGEVSYRDKRFGSILIQAIYYVFNKYAHSDNIEELLKKVSIHMRVNGLADVPHIVKGQTCERTNIGFDKEFFINPPNDLTSEETSAPHFFLDNN